MRLSVLIIPAWPPNGSHDIPTKTEFLEVSFTQKRLTFVVQHLIEDCGIWMTLFMLFQFLV